MAELQKLIDHATKLKQRESAMDTTQEQNDEVGNLLARAADEAVGEAFAREISGHCKIYDVAEVTSMLAKIEGYESESRRRLRKILEPLRDERQAWRPLANVPETLSDDLERLRGQFPHFGPIIDHIELWSVLQCLGDGKFQLAPMLLLGDPELEKPTSPNVSCRLSIQLIGRFTSRVQRVDSCCRVWTCLGPQESKVLCSTHLSPRPTQIRSSSWMRSTR